MEDPSSSYCSQTAEGPSEPPVWFAINTDEDAAALLKRCGEKNCLFPRSPNRDLLKLSEEEAGEEQTLLAVFLSSFLLPFYPNADASLLCGPQASWRRLDLCWPGTAATVSARHVAAAPSWRRADTKGAV